MSIASLYAHDQDVYVHSLVSYQDKNIGGDYLDLRAKVCII